MATDRELGHEAHQMVQQLCWLSYYSVLVLERRLCAVGVRCWAATELTLRIVRFAKGQGI